MNVLISSAGRRVSLVEAFRSDARSLGRELNIFACDVSPELSSACQRADDYFRVPRLSETDYIETLLAQCQARDIALVVPTIDTELQVLAENRELFLAHGIQVVVSDPEFVTRCADKRQAPEFLRRVDLETPTAVNADEPEFPLFAKPRFGSSSKDLLVVRVPDDLRPEHRARDKFVLERYMSPDLYDEITIDLYYDQSSALKCLVPRLRIECRSGEVSKGRTFRDETYEYLKQRLQIWPGARGCVTLQVFANHTRDEIRAIEVNPRFGGGYPLTHQSGAHYPRWLIQEYMLDQPVDFFDEWEADLLMLRYDEGVFVSAP